MSSEPVQIGEADIKRLAKMLGLLGSSSAGERAAAALKAHEWVSSRGLVWEELLIPPDVGTVSVTVGGHAPPPDYAPNAPQPGPAIPMPPWATLVQQFVLNHGQLTRDERELAFLGSQLERVKMYGLRTRLSDKQEAWLRDILGRAGLTW